MKILIASCIRQKPEILKQFLESLDGLEKPCEYEYFFVATLDEESRKILSTWARGKPVTMKEVKAQEEFVVDEVTHRWTPRLVQTMMELRNMCIEEAVKGDYDFLFSVDSDTYLHPHTLRQLLSRGKDIITEIHWTRWHPEEQPLPNVWFFNKYGFYGDSFRKLRTEELVEVGGLGGIVLISKKTLREGVDYSRIPNLNPEWGEDRHFSIRAEALGFKLWVDTKYPSFHIYRDGDLERLESWKENGFAEAVKETYGGGVLITVPHTGVLRAELVQYLLNVVSRNLQGSLMGVSVDLSWGMPVDSNRNRIVKGFLASDNEWLLMIDSDIEPPAMVLEELLSHNKRVAGAVCWSSMGGEKGGRWERFGIPYPVVMKKNPKGGWNVDREAVTSGKRLIECDAASTACVLIHREMLESIEPPWFRFEYDEDGVCNAGEDFTFFDKVRAKGYKVFVDLALQCGHYKTVEIKRFNELLAETERKSQCLRT